MFRENSIDKTFSLNFCKILEVTLKIFFHSETPNEICQKLVIQFSTHSVFQLISPKSGSGCAISTTADLHERTTSNCTQTHYTKTDGRNLKKSRLKKTTIVVHVFALSFRLNVSMDWAYHRSSLHVLSESMSVGDEFGLTQNHIFLATDVSS